LIRAHLRMRTWKALATGQQRLSPVVTEVTVGVNITVNGQHKKANGNASHTLLGTQTSQTSQPCAQTDNSTTVIGGILRTKMARTALRLPIKRSFNPKDTVSGPALVARLGRRTRFVELSFSCGSTDAAGRPRRPSAPFVLCRTKADSSRWALFLHSPLHPASCRSRCQLRRDNHQRPSNHTIVRTTFSGSN
jgi:hypothetical protein